MDYLNFDLEIASGHDNLYPVTVRLPAGIVQGVLRFPFEQHILERYLDKLENALLRPEVDVARCSIPRSKPSVSSGHCFLSP